MAKPNFASVDDYIATQPAPVRATLQRVRDVIRTAAPNAEEVISYQMPTYKLPGGTLVYFAGWKKHYSIYPATERVIATLEAHLAPYEVEKGTIRFPFSKTVPVELIQRIVELRTQEVAERSTPKAARRRSHNQQ